MTALEHAEDIVLLRAAEARVAAGQGEYLPVEMVERLLAGDSAVRVWREHRGLTAKALATAADVGASLCEIEAGKRPGSLDAMARIARALGVSLDDLAPAH